VSDLPVLLPRIEDFKPDDSGVSPLARVREWYETQCPECGADARRETDVSDTFLDSAWYFIRYPSAELNEVPFDPELTAKWLPVDTYIGGNEHAVMHLMYARFITMALHDLGHIDFEEPFSRFRAHGLIINEGSKMSKSRGKVIVPDSIIDQFGADTLRVFLMFLGPFEQGGDYREQGLHGPHGFLSRLWQSVVQAEDRTPDPEVERKLHQTIRQVSEQLPGLHYNTAIAAMMEYLNAVRAGGRIAARGEVEPLVVMIAPFAPHLAEELYQRLGYNDGVFESAAWPSYDPAKLVEERLEIVVQVQGKVRGQVEVAADADEETVTQAALGNDNVSRFLKDKTVRKTIYVPGKLINLVVG
jgi:leucyl-tRNA synthetase